MKKLAVLILSVFSVAVIFSACGNTDPEGNATDSAVSTEASQQSSALSGTQIALSDSGITVNSSPASSDTSEAVYIANDIVYYESGHDLTYGEGGESDAHSPQNAKEHAVVHITKPGEYILSGKLSKGQVAVDLGDGAKENPEAVVTLVFNNANITCEVAPAVIFYNVYECSSKDADTAVNNPDTSAAGANVIIADNSENTVTGSYVARIYKPGTVVLNSSGTEVEDAEKLHKYDGAFYSKMSMNIGAGELGNGTLNINAANEGLDSELHLTVNGGNINIVSGNDGINTNEDNVSVTTVNGGNVSILVNGQTGEGDGIDSNGWLVINGGSVFAQACSFSGDAGIDSDMGIHINGGKVFATGNMLDRISDSKQNFSVFTFNKPQQSGVYTLKNSQNETVAEREIANSFSYLIISDENLVQGDYTLWSGETQFQGINTENMGGGKPMGNRGEDMTPPEEFEEGMSMPFRQERPERPEDIPEGTPPHEKPEGMSRPEMPEGMTFPEGEIPEGMPRPGGNFDSAASGSPSTSFSIKNGGNYFSAVEAV